MDSGPTSNSKGMLSSGYSCTGGGLRDEDGTGGGGAREDKPSTFFPRFFVLPPSTPIENPTRPSNISRISLLLFSLSSSSPDEEEEGGKTEQTQTVSAISRTRDVQF